MSSFTEKINQVYYDALTMLQCLIDEYGVESEVNGNKCFPIPDDFQDNVGLNLENRSYIVEVQEQYFVRADGQYAFFNSISMDRFCEIVDQIDEEYG